MNYRPLIMCAEMALAYRLGKKRQTRRIISKAGFGPSVSPRYSWHFRDARMQWQYLTDVELRRNAAIRPGDGFWLREPIYHCQASWSTNAAHAAYRSDGSGTGKLWRWKPNSLGGRYMPKVLCRTLGECLEVRVERVQDIDDAGAIAEGITGDGGQWATFCTGDAAYKSTPRLAYSYLWDSLHGKKPGERFEDNPWVYVYCLSEPITTDYATAQAILGEGETQ